MNLYEEGKLINELTDLLNPVLSYLYSEAGENHATKDVDGSSGDRPKAYTIAQKALQYLLKYYTIKEKE